MSRVGRPRGVKGRGRKDVRLVRPGDRSSRTAQTPGLRRETAIDGELAGARNLWMGFVTMEPGVVCEPHHHGKAESGVYLLSGSCRFRFGDKLQESIDAGPGDFVYVPPLTVHQEVNLSPKDLVEFIVVRDSPGNVVVPVRL